MHGTSIQANLSVRNCFNIIITYVLRDFNPFNPYLRNVFDFKFYSLNIGENKQKKSKRAIIN